MQIKNLFVLAPLAVFSLAEASSFARVQNDIHNKMSSAVMDFNVAVNAFPLILGTHRQGMAIHNSGKVLNSVIANTTSDINGIATKFSDAEAQDLYGHLRSLEPDFLKSLSGIAARKPAIGLIPDVLVLIKQDLATMKTRADKFMDAFIGHVPLTAVAEARIMKSSVDAMFASLHLLFNI